MFSQPAVWLCILSATVVSVIPDLVVKTIENLIELNKVNKLKRIEVERESKSYVHSEIFDDKVLPQKINSKQAIYTNSRQKRKVSNVDTFQSPSQISITRFTGSLGNINEIGRGKKSNAGIVSIILN